MILHSEKLHDQYPTPNIRMIKSKIMISVDHVARMWERCIQGFGEGKNHLEDLGVDGRIILKWLLKTK